MALILALVECSLGPIVETIRAVDKASTGRIRRTKASVIKLSSSSSKSDGQLYHVSSLSLVYLSECSSSNELGGVESSD